MAGILFQIFGVQITGKHTLRVKNLKVDRSLHKKLSPRLLPSPPPTQREIIHSLFRCSVFLKLCFPSHQNEEAEGNYEGFISPLHRFCGYKSKELPNSLLTFYLCFWVYYQNKLGLWICFVLLSDKT